MKPKRNCDVSISDITARNDQYQKKADDVNQKLREKYRGKKFTFLKSWKHYNGKGHKRFKSSPK